MTGVIRIKEREPPRDASALFEMVSLEVSWIQMGHFCMLLTCTSWWSTGQADEHTLLCEDLLLRYVIVYKIECKTQCYHYVFCIFFGLDQNLKTSFAFIFNQFRFPALCFLLYCLPSALLEWFLSICTKVKSSGTVSKSLPCKEKLDNVINVGWITSLYFNFESTLWCSLCHRTCIC